MVRRPSSSAVLLLLPGCAYWSDRLADLGDVVSLQAGAGIGLHADAQATDFLRLGIGGARLESLRLADRGFRSGPDFQAGLPLSLPAWVAGVTSGRIERAGGLHLDNRSVAEDRALRRLDVGAGLTVGVVGVRASLRLGELADLVAGLVGLDPADDDAGDAEERAWRAAMEARGSWFAGDPHVHVTPPDDPRHVTATLEETIAMARRRGLDWLILTPHLWPQEPARRLVLLEDLTQLPERARSLAAGDPLIAVGFECTSRSPGHVGVAFWPLERLEGGSFEDIPDRALRDGAFVCVNHPFVRPLHAPFVGRIGVPVGWKGPPGEVTRFGAVEGYNYLWDLGERLFLGAGEERSLEAAWRAADASVRQGRPVVVTGSSDNHRGYLLPGTWVYAPGPLTEAGLAQALRAGRVCVVNDEPATFRARSDRDPTWQGIGGRLEARREVELRWRGRAELFIDGLSQGVHRARFRHRLPSPGGFHAYRIVARGGYSNYIYVNGPGSPSARAWPSAVGLGPSQEAAAQLLDPG